MARTAVVSERMNNTIEVLLDNELAPRAALWRESLADGRAVFVLASGKLPRDLPRLVAGQAKDVYYARFALRTETNDQLVAEALSFDAAQRSFNRLRWSDNYHVMVAEDSWWQGEELRRGRVRLAFWSDPYDKPYGEFFSTWSRTFVAYGWADFLTRAALFEAGDPTVTALLGTSASVDFRYMSQKLRPDQTGYLTRRLGDTYLPKGALVTSAGNSRIPLTAGIFHALGPQQEGVLKLLAKTRACAWDVPILAGALALLRAARPEWDVAAADSPNQLAAEHNLRALAAYAACRWAELPGSVIVGTAHHGLILSEPIPPRPDFLAHWRATLPLPPPTPPPREPQLVDDILMPLSSLEAVILPESAGKVATPRLVPYYQAVRGQLAVAGLTPDDLLAFCTELGLSAYMIRNLRIKTAAELSDASAASDPLLGSSAVKLRLALLTRCYDRPTLQALLDLRLVRPGVLRQWFAALGRARLSPTETESIPLGEWQAGLGLKPAMLENISGLITLNHAPEELLRLMQLRARLLLSRLAKVPSRKDPEIQSLYQEGGWQNEGEIQAFLTATGGTQAQLTSLEHIYYLFSLGDYGSAAYWITMDRLRYDRMRCRDFSDALQGFIIGFSSWATNFYGVSDLGQSVQTRRSLPLQFPRPQLHAAGPLITETLRDKHDVRYGGALGGMAPKPDKDKRSLSEPLELVPAATEPDGQDLTVPEAVLLSGVEPPPLYESGFFTALANPLIFV